MYAAYITELRAVCRAKGMTLELLGTVNRHGAYPLYKIVLNDTKRAKRTICFSAGIHGDETSGPLGILEFLRGWKKGWYAETKIILLPVCNPWGYDRGLRTNGHRNLNRHFCDRRLSDESAILYNAVRHEKLSLFCALHEDEDKEDFYFYAYNKHRAWDQIYDAIRKTAKRFIALCSHPTIYGLTATRGVVFNKRDGAFEDRMYRDCVPYSLCLEISDTLSIESRVAMNVALMSAIIRHTTRL